MRKKALITGITGQDGCYLSQFLLSKDYDVQGFIRKEGKSNLECLDYLGIGQSVKLIKVNLLDGKSVKAHVKAIKPHELYHLAAISSVSESFREPQRTLKFNLTSTLNVLEAVRMVSPRTKFYQASSSEMFGQVKKYPATEQTPFTPLSPYGISKTTCHWMVRNYRKSYNLFCCCGILFNHESVLRPEHFVVKKIISTAVRIQKGVKVKLRLGNIDVKRDWGYAPEYVKAMWLILQQRKPDDYVLATGESHSLRDILEETFKYLGLRWKDHVAFDKTLFRQSDIVCTYGCADKMKKEISWRYDLRFKDLIKLLVDDEVVYQGKIKKD